jgi:uncharacterized membrane protein
MKNPVKFKYIIFLLIGLLLVGCQEEIIEKATLQVENLQMEVAINESGKINIVLQNETESTNVIYFSGNDEIATVDNQGNVLGISQGEVTILVYIEGEDETFEVQVFVIESPQGILETISSWVKSTVSTEANTNITLPATDLEFNAVITWSSDNEAVVTSSGQVFQEFDTTANLTYTIAYESETITETILFTVIGYAYELVADEFLKQFSNLIIRDYPIIKTTNYSYPQAVITWESSNEDVFKTTGVYEKPQLDTPFIIYVHVSFPDQEEIRTYEKAVVAQGITIYEKTDEIEGRILADLNLGKVVNSSIELPVYDATYEATLNWFSSNSTIMTKTGAFLAPVQNQMMTLRCEVTIDHAYDSFTIEFEAAGKDYDVKWEAIDDFLDLIFMEQIKTQRYTMYGATSYTTHNYGYLPFYTEARSVILDGMVPFADRPGMIKTETRWVVIHDTANTNVGANAEMHTRYIKSNPGVSWHYSIDDQETYQHVPNNEVAYHAGAKEGNYYGIGIETCLNQGIDYNVVMRRTAKLTAELLIEFDLSLYNVRQHYYYSGKDCPHVMRAANRWNEFLNLVAIEYFAQTKLNDVSFVWESLTPEVLDNTGKVINTLGAASEVMYKVTVTYNNESREFTNTSTLLAKSW